MSCFASRSVSLEQRCGLNAQHLLERGAIVAQRVSDAPEELEALCAKLLQKSPEDRFQSMEDVLLRPDPILQELQVDPLRRCWRRAGTSSNRGVRPCA